MFIVVTGSKGAGKSSSLAKVSEMIRTCNKSVGGVISPRIWKDGERTGYGLITAADGVKRMLATEVEGVLQDTFKYCTFFFSNDVVDAGNNAIRDGLGADVLIVDEIGNMEIAGGGWGRSMPLVAGHKRHVILCVREDVVDKLRGQWGIIADKIIRVTPGEDIAGEILLAIGL